MPKLSSAELNELYEEAKSVDKESFAEFRSNILLIAGDHYTKRVGDRTIRSRTNSNHSESYKLRITKNWLHRARRLYASYILDRSPGVRIMPRKDTELRDQKQAELNQSVWEYLKDTCEVKNLIRETCNDYVGVGEAGVKLYFDPMKGKLKGYEGMVDEMGMPVVDEMGMQLPDETRPVFEGAMVIERLYAHNLFRCPSARSMRESPWLGLENVVPIKELKDKYKDDEDKLKLIQESDEDFIVFEAQSNGYSKKKNQCLLLEYYWKPSSEYRNGWYVVKTKAGILEEGELPGGIFPVEWCGFDEHPTKVRATSIVKVARPWQAEINRASSMAALHQITIGEDKILYQDGTSVTQGALLPGVRGLKYQGAPPTILPGRSGGQFDAYIDKQEAEMSRALMLDLLDADKLSNLEPFTLLFRSMNQSQKFSEYSTKFGEFWVRIATKALELAKFYLPDDQVVAAVGRSEAINMAEFRSTVPLHYQIQIDEQEDTIETALGRQIMTNHILQYVGTNLSKEDIGKLIHNSPFGNWKDSFSDFMIDDKNVKNDFLAIERGEQPMVSESDDSKYVLKQIAKRKKERDFQMLAPEIQDMYLQYEQYHLDKMKAEAEAVKAAQSEYIPVGGALVACDMYAPNSDPNKAPKRVRVPYQALDWLVKNLEQQGATLQSLEQMNQAQVAEIANSMLAGQSLPAPGQVPM